MKRTMLASTFAALICLLLSVLPAQSGGQYDPGATDEYIKIGDIHPLSRPASRAESTAARSNTFS